MGQMMGRLAPSDPGTADRQTSDAFPPIRAAVHFFYQAQTTPEADHLVPAQRDTSHFHQYQTATLQDLQFRPTRPGMEASHRAGVD